MECALRQIDPQAQYEVTMAWGWERSAPLLRQGHELACLSVTLPDRPSSQLVEYRRL